jgi:hypothetical protein
MPVRVFLRALAADVASSRSLMGTINQYCKERYGLPTPQATAMKRVLGKGHTEGGWIEDC